MLRRDLFKEDVVQSERNDLKVAISYIGLKGETARSKEVGYVVALINVPSRILLRGEEAEAVGNALNVLGTHTGFFLNGGGGGGGGARAVLTRKTYSIQSTYLLKHRITGDLRSWTGSWNTKSNAYSDIGVLEEYQTLVSGRQLVESLRRWSTGNAIETKINSNEVLGNKSTDWEFDATVSLCIVINLRGFFPPALRPRLVKVTLD
jgi:hypothetical protein